ncbi:AAA family ATPase [Pseudonocardia saturnea]
MADLTDDGLVDAVLDLASADPDLPEDAKYLVLAALDGDDALADALQGEHPPPRTPASDPTPQPEPVGAYLRSITVAGFRGIGPARTLDLHPAAGLTIVAGRNGSGKSSFAEALEVALTGDSKRRRTLVEWQGSWTNLHSSVPRHIRVKIAEEGVGATTVGVDWPSGTDTFTDLDPWIQRPDQQRQRGVAGLGWERALELCSPLLPHEELGRLLTAPRNELYVQLEKILGLGRFAEAQQRLDDRHKAAAEPERLMREERRSLKKLLDGSADERAGRARQLLGKHSVDIDALRDLVTGSALTAAGTSAGLAALTEAPIPDPAEIRRMAGALREAAAAVPPGGDATADLAARRGMLLRGALTLHAAHGDQLCPVCGQGGLDQAWRAAVETELADGTLDELNAARETLSRSRTAVEHLLGSMSPPTKVPGVEISTLARARTAVQTFLTVPEGDRARADHLDATAAELIAALSALGVEAGAIAKARQDAWAPLATAVGGWIELAVRARATAARADLIGSACTWLRANVEQLRNQQLAPLAAQTGAIWAALRQESNVDIRSVTLPNPVGKQKRVQIKASVDGVDTGAFGVMSTGELHAVTLALFLPRATRPESPFRFVVLDDPVQAMDPSKIDGFVRVLAGIAVDRQVIVFSHDDRLPEAARRLAPDTRIVEVTRAQHSVVSVDESRDPAQRALADAQGLLDDPRVPDEVRRRVLPGLCRSAFESAARDTFYARAYAAGWSRDDVERVWNKVRKGPQRVALARHADADVDVSTWIGAKPWRRNALDVCGRAVHLGLVGHPGDAVADVRRLVAELRSGS